MPDYSQAKIYKIIGGDECYIGSTVEKYLSNRMGGHRTSYKLWKNGKTNFTSSFTLFDKYGLENCTIELIEVFPCSCVEELRKREKENIQEQICVNKASPIRTKNEEKIYKQKYAEEHKEEIQQYKQQYREEHKEEISSQGKQYYELNKEKIRTKYTCECGSVLQICKKARHERSKKHLTFLQK